MNLKRLSTALLVMAAWMSAGRAFAQNTDGKVTYTVTTVNYAGGYDPKHVTAIWVVNGSGTFVKTLSRRAQARMNYLYKWIADRGSVTAVDGVTSATLAVQPQTHTVTWDCRNASGQLVPDGAYIFRAEYTSSNGQGPYTGSHCQFFKGASPVTTNFPNYSNAGGQFTGLKVTYTPYNEIGLTGLAPATAALNASVPVTVTVSNQTLNTLAFTVALTNVSAGTAIGVLPVAALAGKAVTNLTFTWNTAGLPAAAYQVRAVASRLATETNLTDNVMTRDITLSSPLAADIAVTGLSPAAGAVNSSVPVLVAVTNKTAAATGPFTVALEAPFVSQQSVSLAAFAGATVTFPWDTAGLPVGVYDVRAQALPLATETYTADNVVTGSLNLRVVTHDLAVSALALAALVPPNVTTNVAVTVTNRGDLGESFSLTLRDVTAAPVTIGSRTFSNLAARAGAEAVFAWNTATNGTFKLGTHVLQAEITPVAGETDTANNSRTLQTIVSPGLATHALVGKGSVWKYLDTALDISAARWQTPDYFDGGWAAGAAPLGYGLSPIATTTRRTGAAGAPTRTTYLRQTFFADAAPLSLTGRVMRAHGVVLYLNGVEIARQNMPEGAVAYDTLAAGAVTGAAATNFFGFAIDPALVLPGKNLLAAELHLSSSADTTAGFALELESAVPVTVREPRVTPLDIAAEGTAQAGDGYGIFVDLVNSGNVSTPCLILLRDAATGAVVASQAVDALAPGESASVKLTWPTFGSAAGAHTLQALTVINGVTNLAQAVTLNATVDAPDFSPRRVTADGSVGGRCSAVAVAGRYVYLGCGATLEVWDAAVAAAPVRVGLLRLPGVIEDLAVSGTWVFAAAGSAGVQIVDATAPSDLRHRATFDTSGFARRLALAGDLLYIADSLGGIRVLNVASPAAPALAGAYPTAGPAQAVAAVAPRLLALDAQSGLLDLAAANPASLTVSGALRQLTAGLALAAVPGAVLVSDANSWVSRVDTSDPAAPALVTRQLLPAAGRELAASGPALYVAAGGQGLLTLDAATLALQSARDVGGEACDVAVVGATLYVAAGYGGCRALDISEPLSPAPLAVYATGARAVDAAAAGSTLYVAGAEGGLQVHDMGNPALPERLGAVTSVSNARCIEVSHPLAYVGDGLYGLKIFNITNAAAPVLVGAYAADGLSHIRRMALSGTRLVLTDGRVLQLVSVADPAAPVLLASVANAPGSFVFDVAVRGDQAYAACGNAGLRIYGLDNNLNLDHTYQTPGPATSVTCVSNLLHVTCGPYGWQTLSVAVNPVSPALVSSTPGKAFQIAASGSQLFLSDGGRRAQAWKGAGAVTNYLNLTQALRVRAVSGLMLVAEDEAGLSLLNPKWPPVVPAGVSATVGARFEMALPEAFALALRVTVKGLPYGVRYSAASRTLAGVPTQPGVYTVSLAAPGVATQTVKITVEALPGWAWGSFNGFVEGGGIASMSVTALGRVSGKLTYQGASYSFSASSYAGGNAADGFALTVSARKVGASVPLKLLVGRPEGAVPATLGVAEGVFGDAVRLALYRNVWRESAAVLAPYTGYYTASLPGQTGYGSGYLTLTVDSAGRVKTAGKLADGTSMSMSGTLILDGDGRVFAVVYTAPYAYKGGFLSGLAEFAGAERDAVFLRLLDGVPFQWQSRNPQATARYGEGFARETAVTGGWYDKIGNLYDYYRNRTLTVGTGENATVPELTVRGKRSAATWWDPAGVTIAAVTNGAGVMTGLKVPEFWLMSASGASDDEDDEEDDEEEDEDAAVPSRSSEMTIALVRSTGLFSGAFKVWFDSAAVPTSRSVKYQGVLTPVREDMADGRGGGGYFLWSDQGSYTTSRGSVASYGFSWSYDLRILLSAPAD